MLLNAMIVNWLTQLKMAGLLRLSLSTSSKSTLLVGGLALFSRLLGFLRDVLIAHYFGVTLATDAFFAAFRFPNLLRRLFAEGAFAQAFMPVLAVSDTQASTPAHQQAINTLATQLSVLMLGITFLGILLAPLLIGLFAAGFDWQSPQHQLATQLLQIMLPYGFFITLTAFMGSILNAHAHFALPAFTPALLNIAMMGATCWLTPYFQPPIIALAVGVFIGGVLQLALQMQGLRKLGVLPVLQRNAHHSQAQPLLRRVTPTLFANSATQINFIINTLIASFLATGSVSWLYYADRLIEFPSGILGTALTSVMLPKLAKSHANHAHDTFSQTLDWGIHLAILLGAPATVGLYLLAEPILSVLFQSTEFTASDVHACAQTLRAYTLGLMGFLTVKVLTPALTSRHIHRVAVRYTWFCLIVNLILAILLARFFTHWGIALASALSTSLNALVLLFFLVKKRHYAPSKKWYLRSAQILFSSAVLVETLNYFSHFAVWTPFYLLKSVAIGGASYFASLLLSGYFYTEQKK